METQEHFKASRILQEKDKTLLINLKKRRVGRSTVLTFSPTRPNVARLKQSCGTEKSKQWTNALVPEPIHKQANVGQELRIMIFHIIYKGAAFADILGDQDHDDTKTKKEPRPI